MKSRTVIILWAAAVILGIIACIVQFGSKDDSTSRTKLAPGDKLIADLPMREITQVFVSQGDTSTEIKLAGADTWQVAERDNYPTNRELLRNLLGALNEIKITQAYPADSKHHARFGLAESSDEESERGLRVIIKKADGSIAADIFLGKYSGTSRSGGRFTRRASDNSGVYAVGETFPGITADPKDWLDTNFIKIQRIKTISVAAPEDPEFKTWTLIRHPNTDGTVNEKGQFKVENMTEDEVMQLTSTSPLRNLFSFASFQDILTEQQANKTTNPDKKLKRVATITTFDGLTYTITFWPQKDKPKDSNADPRLPAVQASNLLTVSVTADLKEKRIPAEGEKPEEAKKLDAQHTDQQKALKEKLASTKVFEGRIYQVGQSVVAPLQKQRSDFVKTKDKPAETAQPNQG